MKAEKDKKTGKWLIQYRYTDWQGKRRKSTKRGFATKREAEKWLRNFLITQKADFDMKFEDFWKMYCADMETRLREHTMRTKKYIVELKILPYFGNKRVNDITAADIRQWQNELIKMGYSPTYLKTINNQLSAIFNYAVRYYDLKSNPCAKAGSMGKSKAEEMDFWTGEEFRRFIDSVMNKRLSYMAFMTLYWTGMRLGELRALTPADFETNMLSITKSYQRITSPFKGQMSCVRELKLVQKEKKYILKQLPVKEMECLRTNKHEMKNIKMGADEEWTLCDKKEVLELDISYPIEKIHAQTFGIKISTGKNRQFEIVFCKEKQCCVVDRTTTGVNPHDKFAGKYKAPVDFTQEFLTIKLLMDVSQSELFINNGEVVMSNLLFPEDFYKVKLFATGGDLVIEKSIIYEMDEIMNHPLDEA
ncbi:GH32 C-terminal domain-containing protein [Mediterraneibacter faecis]|uniref:GH32 C-terminal domain-containing protein n=1 Tax=Mediterraneibacter faecis TaxID=592978 RepID=UPI0022E64725|nr:GH32 C-terminal domain-containing protein [Mediterraneibacter faecis]